MAKKKDYTESKAEAKTLTPQSSPLDLPPGMPPLSKEQKKKLDEIKTKIEIFQKELLAKSLQSYFSLDYDPFYPYLSSSEKSGNSYKIKITLIPPLADSKSTDTEENKDDLELKEYFDEQTPQVYENE